MGGPRLTPDEQRKATAYVDAVLSELSGQLEQTMISLEMDGNPIDDMVQIKRSIKEFQDVMKKYDDQLKETLVQRMCEEGETEHQTGDLVCQLLVGRTGSKLSETRLVEQGVSPDVIANSREPGTEYTYVQITRSKESSK